MTIVARAPGKLAVLGEYAVLAGAPALVMAVDRHCRVEIEPSAAAECRLRIRTTVDTDVRFAPDAASGIEIVDRVCAGRPANTHAAWAATLDSRSLYGHRGKLGLGSSAAVLAAWAGAWAEFTGRPQPDVHTLIELHRAWQSGAGSGLDVAASRLGGLSSYRLRADGGAEIVSVTLPDGVGFVGVFSGQASSTRGFLTRFGAWLDNEPAAAREQVDRMTETAERGIAAARANAAAEFLAAAARYAELMDTLGQALGADIVTAEHRAIARVASRYGVTYKVSGAGGGDLGLGLSSDSDALDAFVAALPAGSEALRLGVDGKGLVIEERSA